MKRTPYRKLLFAGLLLAIPGVTFAAPPASAADCSFGVGPLRESASGSSCACYMNDETVAKFLIEIGLTIIFRKADPGMPPDWSPWQCYSTP